MDRTSSNAQQIEYWNDQAGPKWVRLQERLDAQLGPIGDEVLDRAGLAPGERVLDVGCGCGDLTLAAAGRVAPGGHATGVDISGPMLARARERAAASAGTADFVQADAQHDALNPHDVLVSRFGVMFFADPVAAFRRMREGLAPGGRLAFVCWQGVGENPWMLVPMAEVAKLVELPAPPEPGAPGPFAFADADRVRGILEGAGWQQVAFEDLRGELAVGGTADVAEVADFMLDVGPASRALAEAEADDALRGRVVAAVEEVLRPYAGPDGVRLGYAAWIVTAKAGT